MNIGKFRANLLIIALFLFIIVYNIPIKFFLVPAMLLSVVSDIYQGMKYRSQNLEIANVYYVLALIHVFLLLFCVWISIFSVNLDTVNGYLYLVIICIVDIFALIIGVRKIKKLKTSE